MSDTNFIFDKVDPGIKLYRSRFPRRFQKLIDMYPGLLYPILADVMMPGDVVKLGLRWNIKANPSVTPYFTRVKGSVFYFAVPFRMIFGTEYGDSERFFEDLISPPDGDSTNIIPLLTKPEFFQDLGPEGSGVYFSPTRVSNGSIVVDSPVWTNERPSVSSVSLLPYVVSLSNCFGYETWTVRGSSKPTVPTSVKYPPTVTFHRAYWRIVSDYFTDEDTQSYLLNFRFKALSSAGSSFDNSLNSFVLATGYPFPTLWSRDYFMSALKDFLKGTPPALDVGNFTYPGFSGTTSAFDTDIRYTNANGGIGHIGAAYSSSLDVPIYGDSSGRPSPLDSKITGHSNGVNFSVPSVTISGQGAFGVDDMRLAFAVQRIMERANRCGSRYTEYLLSTFNTAPSDGTLQRPWYIGGIRFNIVTPEVLQTSESATTPQGTRSGAGFSVGGSKAGIYHCKEWSVLMAVCNIEPEATYMQGIPRVARYKSRWDFFNPSMQNLSEQVVEKGELYADVLNTISSYNPSQGFGYQGMWNELRTKQDEVSGNFRWSELNNWHMALKFSSSPGLSDAFKRILTYFSCIMRPFAVQNMPPFLCDFYHDNIWIRPMVRHPVPGLIDHN